MCTQIGHTSKRLHPISHLHFASTWQCLRAISEHHKLSRAHWYIVCNCKGPPILFFYHQECFTKYKGDGRCRGTSYREICRRAAARRKAAHQGMSGTFQAGFCRVRLSDFSQRMKHPLSQSWANKELLSSTSCQSRGVRAHLQCSCTLIFTSGCAMLVSTTQISLCDLDLDWLMRLQVHKQEKLELFIAPPSQIKTWIKLWYKLGAATHFYDNRKSVKEPKAPLFQVVT